MALQLDFTITSISEAVTNARYKIEKDGVTSVATGLIDIPSNGFMSLPMDTVDVLEKDLVSIHLDDFNGSNSVDAQSCFGWANIINADIAVTYETATVTLKNPTYVTGTWDFGDGSATTTTVDPVYDYGASGTFTIVFTSDGGVTYSQTVSLTYILLNFYDNGEAGAWYKASDTSTLFQDVAGTTSANSVGEPVGLWVDTSPNALDATQSVSASRATYSTTPVSNLSFDLVDDELVVPLVAGNYTVFEQSPNGLLEYTITTTADWIRNSLLGSISEIIIVNGTPDIPNIRNYLLDKHGNNRFSGLVDASGLFHVSYGRGEATSLNANDWDTSGVTDFYTFMAGSHMTTIECANWDTSSATTFSYFAQYCLNLTTIDVSNWNVSSVTNFESFVTQALMTTLDVSLWDVSSVTNFRRFVNSCGNLTALDVSNWDVSSVTNFDQFVKDCSSLSVLDVSNWNVSRVTNFEQFVSESGSLTTLDISNWDTSQMTSFKWFASKTTALANVTVTGGAGNPLADSTCTKYAYAFWGTNLTQQSIDDILVAINAAGTSNGSAKNFQTGGSAPSATGNAAIDGLRSRGWTITVTGNY